MSETADDVAGRRPAHRIAGRGLVVGAGSFPVVALLLGAFLLAHPVAEVLQLAFGLALGGAVGGFVLVIGVEAALRVRPWRRVPVLLATGVAGTFLVSGAVGWVAIVLAYGPGRGPRVFTNDIVAWWLDHPTTGAANVAVAATLLLGLGLPRVLPWRGAPPWPRAARLAAGLATGLAATGVTAALSRAGVETFLEPWEFWDLPGATVAGAVAAAAGLEVGEALDLALVRWWRARRDP